MIISAQEIGPHSNAGEVANRLADLALGFFGSVKPTDQDQSDLGEALIGFSVRWINERFELGIPSED